MKQGSRWMRSGRAGTTSSSRRWLHLLVGGTLVTTACGAPFVAPPQASAAGPNLVVNGSFESGTTGWRANGAQTTLSTISGGVDSAKAGQLTASSRRNLTLNDSTNSASNVKAGTRFKVSAWVRSSQALDAEVRVREVKGNNVTVHGQRTTLSTGQWQQLTAEFVTTTGASELDLNVVAWNAPSGTRFAIDQVSLQDLSGQTSNPVPPAAAPNSRKLTNGCSVSARGIPACGAYFGAATGSNGNPASFERDAGQPLGVRRTFWNGGQVTSAVRTASEDLAARRLPWMSFKMPYSWADMATGRGDAWARDLAKKLSALNGPVWVTFHHEPELDGNIAQWTAMQARLAPIVRSTAPNVGYTIIVTGWHQTAGDTQKYALEKIWPKNTTIDLLAFDTYNFYGTPQSKRKSPANLRTDYFEFLSSWAKKNGVAWGIGETGYTDATAAADPNWLRKTYDDLVSLDGVAMSYFNSSLNATGDWLLDTSDRRQQFTRVLRGSPHLQ